jgi:hypothetical protein
VDAVIAWGYQYEVNELARMPELVGVGVWRSLARKNHRRKSNYFIFSQINTSFLERHGATN